MLVETYNLYSLILYTVSALIALGMLIVVTIQLSKLRSQVEQAFESNSLSRINALITLEQQIAERRTSLAEISLELAAKQNENLSDLEVDILTLKFNEAEQMYLNVLDRFCFCCEKEYLDDEEMRLEYRDTIKHAVSKFDQYFKTGTQYRNIKKTYERWVDK